jgi:hypothetical protein
MDKRLAAINENIYSDKWITPESLKAYREASKYLDRSSCMSHIPYAWASEILDLMVYIDTNFGIARETHTDELMIKTSDVLDCILSILFYPVKEIFVNFTNEIKSPNSNRSSLLKMRLIYRNYVYSIGYGLRRSRLTLVNPFINWFLKPKVNLLQVKEKFGTLRVYFSCTVPIDDCIEMAIKETEVKLSVKGAYLEPKELWEQKTIRYNSYSSVEAVENGEVYKCTEQAYRKTLIRFGFNFGDQKDEKST